MELGLQNMADMVYCTTAMLSMYEMQQKGIFCDFSIIVLPSTYNNLDDCVTYKVHRLLFSTSSKRIQDLKNSTIKLGGNVTCEGVEHVIEYVYTGQIAHIDELSVESLTQFHRAALALSIQSDEYIKQHKPEFVSASTKIYVGELRKDEKDANKSVVTISKSTPSGELVPLDISDNNSDWSSTEEDENNNKTISKLEKRIPPVNNNAQMLLNCVPIRHTQKRKNNISKNHRKKGQITSSTEEASQLITLSKKTPNPHLGDIVDETESIPLKKRKCLSKAALEKRKVRAKETPEQKALRREKDRIRKIEFRQRKKEVLSQISETSLINNPSESMTDNTKNRKSSKETELQKEKDGISKVEFRNRKRKEMPSISNETISARKNTPQDIIGQCGISSPEISTLSNETEQNSIIVNANSLSDDKSDNFGTHTHTSLLLSSTISQNSTISYSDKNPDVNGLDDSNVISNPFQHFST